MKWKTSFNKNGRQPKKKGKNGGQPQKKMEDNLNNNFKNQP